MSKKTVNIVILILTIITILSGISKTMANHTIDHDITGDYVISIDEIAKKPQYIAIGVNKIGTLETATHKQELSYNYTDEKTGIEYYTMLYKTQDKTFRYNIIRNPKENPNVIIMRDLNDKTSHYVKWVKIE